MGSTIGKDKGNDKDKANSENEISSKELGMAIKPTGKEEIIWLRDLNQLLVQDVNKAREDNVSLLFKLTQMDLYVQDLERKLESKIENLHGEFTKQVKVGEQLNDGLKDVEKDVEDYLAASSKQLQYANENFRKNIFKKEEECRAMVTDKKILEATVAQLVGEISTMESKSKSLEQQVNEGVEQRLDLIKQHIATEKSLQQRNKILQEELERTGRLLQAQNRRVEELEGALNNESKKCQALQAQNQRVEELEAALNNESKKRQALQAQNQRVEAEFQAALNNESKKRQALQARSLVLENGKSRSIGSLELGKSIRSYDSVDRGKPKPNHVHECGNAKSAKPLSENRTSGKAQLSGSNAWPPGQQPWRI